ncbi:MAG: hypothetical protein EZS28_048168, partial [Streblomastix strix]
PRSKRLFIDRVARIVAKFGFAAELEFMKRAVQLPINNDKPGSIQDIEKKQAQIKREIITKGKGMIKDVELSETRNYDPRYSFLFGDFNSISSSQQSSPSFLSNSSNQQSHQHLQDIGVLSNTEDYFYYRWKVFSFVSGDSEFEWNTNPFRPIVDGPIIIPPPMLIKDQQRAKELQKRRKDKQNRRERDIERGIKSKRKKVKNQNEQVNEQLEYESNEEESNDVFGYDLDDEDEEHERRRRGINQQGEQIEVDIWRRKKQQ